MLIILLGDCRCQIDKNCQKDSNYFGGLLPIPFGEEWPPYLFDIPVSIRPFNGRMKLTDTLFITVNITDILTDNMTSRKYKLADFPLSLSPHFDKINPINQIFYALSADKEIEVKLVIGSLEAADKHNTYDINKYYCNYSSTKYDLTLAVIPKGKGVYKINFVDLELPKQKFPESCSMRIQRGTRMKLDVNKGKSNYELLQDALGPMWQIKPAEYNSNWYRVWHDTIRRYKQPFSDQFYYCFVVE